MKINLNTRFREDLNKHPDPASVNKLTISPHDLALAKTETLSLFSNVEELHLHPSAVQHELPLAIFGWKKLHTLTLQGIKTDHIWAHLTRLPQLRLLNIHVRYLEDLPYELSNCRQLEELNWLETRFGNAFNGWHLLEHLPKLAWMNLLRTQFKRSVLEGLEELPLKGLLLPKRHFSTFYKNNKTYCDNLLYTYQYTPAEANSYKNLVQYAQKEGLSWEQRALMLQLLTGNHAKVKALATPEGILSITDLPFLEPLRLQAIQYYTTQWPTSQALHSKATLTVLGKIATNKKVLRQQLQSISLGYNASLQASTTHLLLGQHSKGAYQEALAQQLPLLSEVQVLDYITAQSDSYLVKEAQSAPEQIDNIQQLLYTGDEENTALALAFFEQGGFPKQLLTALFFAYHSIKTLALRKEIGRLLRQYGSPVVVEAMNSVSVSLYTLSSEDHLNRHLQKLHNASELDGIQLAWAIHRHVGHGCTFLLQVLPQQEGIALLRGMMNGKTLLLDSLGLLHVPEAVYELEELKELNVNNNYLTTIPVSQLQKLPQLETIHAGFNYRLHKNKQWYEELRTALPQVKVIF